MRASVFRNHLLPTVILREFAKRRKARDAGGRPEQNHTTALWGGDCLVERDLIKINQNIQVAYDDDQNDWYASNVQDVRESDFCISVPIKGIRVLLLHRGEPVKVTFVAEMERYEFVTRVRGRRQDNIPLFVLDKPQVYVRVQLREFVRVNVMLDIFYAFVTAADEEPVYIRTHSLDLSGGGVRFLVNNILPAGTLLKINFTLPFDSETEKFALNGIVVRSWSEGYDKLCQAAARFVNISRKQVDLISRYLFSKMSEQRRLI